MGLGKTLSALALICHHLDMRLDTCSPEPTQAPKGILIVAPMSSMYELVILQELWAQAKTLANMLAGKRSMVGSNR